MSQLGVMSPDTTEKSNEKGKNTIMEKKFNHTLWDFAKVGFFQNIRFSLFICSVIVLSTYSYCQNSLDNNLILHYTFDNNGKDISKSKLSIYPDTKPEKDLFRWVKGNDGKENSALEFLGTSGGLKPGLNISPSTYPEITITAWVYGRPTGVLLGTSLPKYTNNERGASRTIFFDNGSVAANVQITSKENGKKIVSSAGSIKLESDNWNFIAITVNSKDSTLVLYANDEYYQSRNLKGIPNKVYHEIKGGNLIIGESDNMPGQRLKGIVDEIRIYDKALTKEEIASISGIQSNSSVERVEKENSVRGILILSLAFFFVFAIAFMIYTYIKEKKYKPISDKELANWQHTSESNKTDKTASNELAKSYINNAVKEWEITDRNENGEIKNPTKHKHFVDTFKALDNAKKLAPTDKDLIQRMNEMGGYCNKLSTRRFYGNKLLIIGALLVPVLMFFISGSARSESMLNTIILLLLPIVVYTMASFAPTYLVASRSGILANVFGGIFGALLGVGATVAATQYVRETTWSDGSKTKSDATDINTTTGILGILIMAFAVIVAVVLISIAAIITFLRNYVFYV